MRYSISKIAFVFFICTGFATLNSDSDIQKKIIRTNSFDIEFYVSLKNQKKLAPRKTYYWFKSGEIYHTVSSFEGLLLHSDYAKFYRSNQLAEKGTFHYGLKDGAWKVWNKDGKLSQLQVWSKGVKDGPYYSYNQEGKVELKGHYKNGLQSGPWINFKTKDTIVYTKGEEKVIDTISKPSLLKRIFTKKSDKQNKKGNTNNKNSKNRTNKKNETKDGFFKRLFKKKDKQKTSKTSS